MNNKKVLIMEKLRQLLSCNNKDNKSIYWNNLTDLEQEKIINELFNNIKRVANKKLNK